VIIGVTHYSETSRFDLMDVCVYLGKSTFLEMYRAGSESI